MISCKSHPTADLLPSFALAGTPSSPSHTPPRLSSVTVLCLTFIENPTSSGYRCWALRNRTCSLRSTWATTVSRQLTSCRPLRSQEPLLLLLIPRRDCLLLARVGTKGRQEVSCRVTFAADHQRKGTGVGPLPAGRDGNPAEIVSSSPALEPNTVVAQVDRKLQVRFRKAQQRRVRFQRGRGGDNLGGV
jgi:hypothetical protein